MPQITAENVKFSYNKNSVALRGVSLSVEKGEYVAIIGHNGSGKSTLAKLFNGLLVPTDGEIFVDGLSSRDKNSLFDIRKKVGMVFQNPDNQLVASIVEDDVAFGPENIGVPREEIGERIDFALKAVGMENYRKSSPERLSGGQKQRIAIAGVLALRPEVLVLDESTSMLDPIGRREILKIVKDLNQKEKTTVIAITHYMDEVVNADRVIVLNEGKIIIQGTPREVFAEKKKLEDAGLELPLSTRIADTLRAAGAKIENDVLTADELKEALCRLK